jgi:cysteine desulfurase
VRTYLDHNATSPLRPAVKAAMLGAMEAHGNPSSIHGEGRKARRLVDDAREKLAHMLGCLPQMISFTSGGTEANVWALNAVEVEVILVSAVEHPSILEAAKATGKTVEVLPVDGEGCVRLDCLKESLGRPNTLVSMQSINSETGLSQPLANIAPIVHAAGALLHVDAVQQFKKSPLNFGLRGFDLMSISAHKVGGPMGVGALIARDGLAMRPLLHGGGQELRRRSGTENVAAIAGFAALADGDMMHNERLHRKLESGLKDAVIFGPAEARIGNTTCFAIPGMAAETLLMNLDLMGFAVSSGSACSSGKVGRSHVLAAMGVAPELAACAIRISSGWNTTEDDIARLLVALDTLKARHRARAAA